MEISLVKFVIHKLDQLNNNINLLNHLDALTIIVKTMLIGTYKCLRVFLLIGKKSEFKRFDTAKPGDRSIFTGTLVVVPDIV